MENVKIVLGSAFALGMAVDQAKTNDGKISLEDLFLLAGPAIKIPAAIAAAAAAKEEYVKMTGEQKAELITWAKNEFDVSDDVLEEKIEAGVNMIIYAGAFFKKA